MVSYRKHVLFVGLFTLLVGAVAVPMVISAGPPGDYEENKLRENIARFLRIRDRMEVDHRTIFMMPARGESGLMEVFFLGRPAPGEGKASPINDLYFIHVVASDSGIPVHASPRFSLSKTAVASEQMLRLDPSGYLAYASMTGDRVSVITILNLAGLSTEALSGFSRLQRLQQYLTNWQDTGLWRGLDRIEVRLNVPQRAALGWRDGMLEVTDRRRSWKVVVDPRRAKVLEGPARATHIKVGKRSFVAWAVDTVRGFSIIGPDAIVWLEELVYGVVDKARRMSGTEVTAEDIKDEMDLPIITGVGSKIDGWPPPPLKPILRRRIKGEGKWIEVQGPFLRQRPGLPSYFAMTFVRPDKERLFSKVYFVAWDPRRLELRMSGGTREPRSATGNRGTGIIPREPGLLRRLVAAFNGGFQSVHGDFGMMIDGQVLSPAKPYSATVARLGDDTTAFGTWDGKAKYGWTPGWIRSFRQNLTPMVEDSKYNPWRRGSWGGGAGFLTGSGPKAHIIRSGICLHESGHVMFVMGDPVDGPTLARAMHKVGCSYAMQLDINKGHVGFEFFNVLAKGEAPPAAAATFKTSKYYARTGEFPGVDSMKYFMREVIRRTGNSPIPRWTGREARDFFYLLERRLLPRADLAPMNERPGEGRWTSARLPASLLAFPQAITRTILHPSSARKSLRVHLLQLDLRWLETSLCVPRQDADCLGKKKRPPAVVLPLGAFSDSRKLFADGKELGRGAHPPGAPTHLVLAPGRPGGPFQGKVGPAAGTRPGSVSVQSARYTAAARAGPVALGALCVDGNMLFYASGLGAEPVDLKRVLGHAGCKKMVLLAGDEPLLLEQGARLETIYGDLLPPRAATPSLQFTRSGFRGTARIFTHVKVQPRKVWTAVQPERTRASSLRHANRAAEALGLPPAKKLDDLCDPPYSGVPEMRKHQWRNPITGKKCSKRKKRRRRTP